MKHRSWVRLTLGTSLLAIVPLMSGQVFAQTNEERWNYTVVDVVDFQGTTRLKLSSAAIVEVRRSRVKSGELQYNFLVNEAAGQISGQNEPVVMSAKKGMNFYKEPKTRKLRSNDPDLAALLDFTNALLKKMPSGRKKAGVNWLEIVDVGEGWGRLPRKIAVNFEVQDLSDAGHGKLLLVKYSSKKFRLNLGTKGEPVNAEFSGFTTFDPSRDITAHMVWDFKASRAGESGLSELLRHSIIFFMSDVKGETPVVPLSIYPDLGEWVGGKEITDAAISSAASSPEWVFEALASSKIYWVVTTITGEQKTNFAIVPIIAVLNVLESVCNLLTDKIADGKIDGKGYGLAWVLKKAGVDPYWAAISVDIMKLALPGVSSVLQAVGASDKIVSVILKWGTAVNGLKLLVDILGLPIKSATVPSATVDNKKVAKNCPETKQTDSTSKTYQEWKQSIEKHIPVGKRIGC